MITKSQYQPENMGVWIKIIKRLNKMKLKKQKNQTCTCTNYSPFTMSTRQLEVPGIMRLSFPVITEGR